ncbi:HAD family hydrolase [Clostridium sp. 'deep sea']|uniref:HAD family hydrolase n=1 Tax=Clostridium sp. 'deep sea' TaxID=2779445 RepID=UPI0018968DF8|nr:HAD family hydrolase [Clostridium sp. 'deep sea']QOR33676.1 HAD family hydrolase [Clostridium sp. 'deep sea']
MKKSIFIDCDDTLIVHDKNKSYIPTSSYEAITQLHKNGHRITLSSGRSHFQVEKLMKELKISNAVCFNGHMVIAENKVIYDDPINSNELQPIIDNLLKQNKSLYGLDTDYIYSNDPTGEIRLFIRDKMRPGHANSVDSFEKYIVQLDNQMRSYYFFMIFGCELNKIISVNKNSKISIKHWSDQIFEILNKDISKFSGIKQVINYFNEDINQTIAFGDSYNDLEMVTGTACGVAMGNSPDALKEVADLVTDTIQNDGFYKACKKLKLI